MTKKRWKSIYSIPTKTCPMCGIYVARRIRAHYCPHCGASLYSYRVGRKKKARTIWVTDEPRIKAIAIYTRDKIRELPQMADFDFENWERQLGNSHVLLDMCEGNQHLALTLVDAFYNMDIRHECGIYGILPRSVSGIISRTNRDNLAWLLAWSKKSIEYNREDVNKLETAQVAM